MKDPDNVKFIEDRKFDGWDTVLKSHRSADELARSRNVIEKPDQKNVKDWKGFSELGWVEDPTKYAVAKPKVEQGQVLNEGVFNAFTKAAHGAKLAPWQAETVFGELHKTMNAEIAADTAKSAKELADLTAALQTKWGPDFPVKKQQAERAMKASGLGQNDASLLEKALGSPGLVEFFQKHGELIGEDSGLGGGGGGGGGSAETIAGLEAEIRKMHGDANIVAIINDPRHPQHADYVAQRQGKIDKLARLKAA